MIGVAAVLVPFPAAVDDHQTANAQFLVREGAAVLTGSGGKTFSFTGWKVGWVCARPSCRSCRRARNSR